MYLNCVNVTDSLISDITEDLGEVLMYPNYMSKIPAVGMSLHDIFWTLSNVEQSKEFDDKERDDIMTQLAVAWIENGGLFYIHPGGAVIHHCIERAWSLVGIRTGRVKRIK